MSAVGYERIVYAALGLMPLERDAVVIAETAIGANPAALDAVVSARLTKIRAMIAGAEQIDILPSPAFDTLVTADFLTYAEYRSALADLPAHKARFDEQAQAHKITQLERKADTLRQKLDVQGNDDEPSTGAIQTSGELERIRADIAHQQAIFTILPHEQKLKTFCLRYNPNRFLPTREGYLAYLSEVVPAIFSFSARRLPVTLPEADRQAHTYITGKTGSGKSELLKVLIHSYARQSYEGSVVVIDPHGDFAEQVARFPEIANSGRLVYIAPMLSPAYSPTINPFDIPDRSLGSVATYTEQLIAVFGRLFALSNYGDLTGHMKAILSNCIATLLRTKGSTINDLILFMNDETNEHLVKIGLNSPDETVRDFFANSFHTKHYEATKGSLAPRIQRADSSFVTNTA